MIRGLLKLILIVVLIVGAAAFFLGWNIADGEDEAREARDVVGTTGEAAAERGRAVGAEVGARAGQAADQAQRALADGSITAKIKSKMALDEMVKALNLDVDTTNGVVTVKGVVRSEEERTRALQLARETDGVKQVVDQLTLR